MLGSVTISLWQLLVGAVCGVLAVLGARGSSRLVVGAVIGAAVAVLMDIARGYL
ncbi:hypothetical protein [Oceanicola sp. S124]|uniref:hypothetical protein n=1 Tax=Oceanicola sp. S124 TaxID=1042378 RepID=UPI00143B2C96|nr:hypothetical protein [Oceanicola sp. S124]